MKKFVLCMFTLALFTLPSSAFARLKINAFDAENITLENCDLNNLRVILSIDCGHMVFTDEKSCGSVSIDGTITQTSSDSSTSVRATLSFPKVIVGPLIDIGNSYKTYVALISRTAGENGYPTSFGETSTLTSRNGRQVRDLLMNGGTSSNGFPLTGLNGSTFNCGKPK